LPSEAPVVIHDNRPDPTWPQNGQIQYQSYSTRYRQGLELVLKGVSFIINPREKVGIVGRTGAGKSSLTLSLFRLIEAVDGAIIMVSQYQLLSGKLLILILSKNSTLKFLFRMESIFLKLDYMI
jgi:ABC-type multidrug transport system fused ATPase/permease subunit